MDFSNSGSSIEDEESAVAERWLSWCQSHKLVKCVEFAVPDGILPMSYKGILIDVKISAHGPDDKVYSINKDLRENVARGNCILKLNRKGKNGSMSETKYLFMIFALKKFSGGMGDEDDSPGYQNMWQNFFIQPIDTAKQIICTKKANGEAAHVSSRRLCEDNFYCIGSKNVHMLVKHKGDIEKYKDGRFLVARTVAETFFSQIIDNEQANQEKTAKFIKYLQNQKCTMVNEILQPKYQHVENLSHLQTPQLQFICWTNYESAGESNNLCVRPPNLAIDQARLEFGLLTVEYEIIDALSVESYMEKIRSEFGYEGRVLYFIDDKENVIGVLKKKTAWYIILRAIREKTSHFLSKKSSTSESERTKKITQRICEIQTWLGFSDSCRKSWIELGVAFVAWIFCGSKKNVNNMFVRSQFPILWKQFLESNEKWQEIYSQLEANYN